LRFSAFTSILKAVLEADQSIPTVPSIKRLLRSILVEYGVIPQNPLYYDALEMSLKPEKGWAPDMQTFAFFDNCSCRIARQPVHYDDITADFSNHSATVGTLPACISEQWSYLVAKEDVREAKNTAEWVARLLALFTIAEGNTSLIHNFHNRILDSTKDPRIRQLLEEKVREQRKTIARLDQHEKEEVHAKVSDSQPNDGGVDTNLEHELTFEAPLKRTETMEGLGSINQQDLEELVTTGSLGRHFECLSSLSEEIRRQAFVSLIGLTKSMEVSYSDLLVLSS
jgi:nucleolar pre-ribosomal-associated protein 1